MSRLFVPQAIYSQWLRRGNHEPGSLSDPPCQTSPTRVVRMPKMRSDLHMDASTPMRNPAEITPHNHSYQGLQKMLHPQGAFALPGWESLGPGTNRASPPRKRMVERTNSSSESNGLVYMGEPSPTKSQNAGWQISDVHPATVEARHAYERHDRNLGIGPPPQPPAARKWSDISTGGICISDPKAPHPYKSHNFAYMDKVPALGASGYMRGQSNLLPRRISEESIHSSGSCSARRISSDVTLHRESVGSQSARQRYLNNGYEPAASSASAHAPYIGSSGCAATGSGVSTDHARPEPQSLLAPARYDQLCRMQQEAQCPRYGRRKHGPGMQPHENATVHA
uniref:Uncharacterized protein n=1 Tax=Chrysotila carterae TaxID=13221 RepID=A0A7S4FA37_CHRCT